MICILLFFVPSIRSLPVTDYRYHAVFDPKSDLFTTVLLPQLFSPAYLTIQLLTLVILITYLYSLYLPLVYIETLELHSKIKPFTQFSHTTKLTLPHPVSYSLLPEIGVY